MLISDKQKKMKSWILVLAPWYVGRMLAAGSSIDIIDYTDIVIQDVFNGSVSSSINNKTNQGNMLFSCSALF